MALVVLGWGACLQLIDAPNGVAYQHLRPDAGSPARVVAIGVLLLQAVAVGTIGRAHVAAFLGWCRAHVRPTVLLAVLAILVLPAAVPSANPVVYAREIVVSSALQLLSILTLAVVIVSAGPSTWRDAQLIIERVLGRVESPGPRRVDAWVLRVAGAVVVISAALSWFAYEAHPHVPDEVVYLLHARYFAEGMLTMPLPPVPAAFNLDLMHYESARWFSPVPPGWPMVLAIGAWLGVPWLVNPLLGGVAVVLTYLVMGHITSGREARLTTLILASSPWFLLMSMNLMTHTATLVFALTGALGVAIARERGSWIAPVIGGLGVGLATLVRPLEGLVVALCLGLWSLGARGRRFRLAPSVALVLGTLATGLLDRPYNQVLTGSSSTFPIMAYTDKYYVAGSNDLGFGPNRGLGWGGLDPFPGHGPADVVVNTTLNTAQWNAELLGWPIGAVSIVAIVLTLGAGYRRRTDWWFVAVIAAVVGAHAFYWFSGGPDFGARYWYLIIVPCCALAARGLTVLDEVPGAARRGSVAARSCALVLMGTALLLYVPWRAVGKYRHYRGMRADVRQLARDHNFGRSLVLVRGANHPDYASAAVYNPVDLRADGPIYAWDASVQIREDLLSAYPDRTVWILDGPSLTGTGYRIAAGPLSPDEARASGIPPHAIGRVYDPVSPPPPGSDQ
jgi:4-amino-4-deoxy-L-arabinose transferase-like glycosyltransferase